LQCLVSRHATTARLRVDAPRGRVATDQVQANGRYRRGRE
jgi:hypothetical protein